MTKDIQVIVCVNEIAYYNNEETKEKAVYFVSGVMDKEGKKFIINKIKPPQLEEAKQIVASAVPNFDFDPFGAIA